jgi:3,4-dihydroxy 2-butanone 4-phosphate synthase/GTP cyclohydrolase II
MKHEFDAVDDLIADLKLGKMVILVDDEDRENEGDLVLAADFVTPEKINFMIKEAGGLVCLALTQEQIDRLQLPLMVREEQNHTPNKTAFTVSIEAATGVTTGISAADRARTVRAASNPLAKPGDVHTPGHIFPIRAQRGGVLKRTGHTEGSVDLAQLAGCNPAAVICEVMNDDGTMARVPDLQKFAKKHGIKIGTIVDLMQYRLSREILVEEIYTAPFESPQFGQWTVRVFKNKIDDQEHLVFQKGEILKNEETLVRVQLDSYTRDLLTFMQNGPDNLKLSLEKINSEGRGVLLLLRGNNQTGGLTSEIKTFSHRDMDARDYGVGAQILRQIGIKQIKLLSNRPEKKVGIKAFDLEIVRTISLDNNESGEFLKDEQSSQGQDQAKSEDSKNRSGNFQIQ